jgi:hypothetical protein
MNKTKGVLKRMGCVKLFLSFMFLFFLMVSSPNVYAIEGGLGHYPDGIDDFMLGALPPPGQYFLNYFLYYNIKDFKDLRGPAGSGVDGIKLKDLGAGTPKVEAETVIDALRFVYVTKKKIFGADWGWHIIQPIQYLKFTKADFPPGTSLLTTGVTDKKTGLKDTIIAPVALGWHFSKNLHAIAAMDINIPTGRYNSSDLANTGNGYWMFMPLFAVTYRADSGFEAGVKLMYDFNTTNPETGYYSGQTFHADYLVGWNFGPLAVGANGYYLKQFEKDRMRNPATIPGVEGFDGNKAQAFAYGPAVCYNYKNMFFKAKAQWETSVENRPEGTRFWLNFIYAF